MCIFFCLIAENIEQNTIQVVEQRFVKDANGKKKPAYVVHFQGWNSSWDRQVGEHYLLRNTDENRELMRKLAETAKKFSRKNSQRRRKINGILHEAFGGAPPEFDTISESEESEEESDSGRKIARVKTGPERKRQKTSIVEFEMPDSLKVQLEDDYFLINKKNKLTRIPAKPCILDILESFMKTFCVNYLCDPSGGREKTRTSSSKHTLKCPPDKCVSLCKEFVDSLRIIFDFTLPIILLYAAEQQQYETAMKDIKHSDLHAKEKEVASSSSSSSELPQKGTPNSNCKTERATRQHHHQSPSSPSAAEPSFRRITRRSLHETTKADKNNLKSKPSTSSNSADHRNSKHSEHSPPKTPHPPDEPVIPIASRTRRRAQFEVVELSSGIIIKQEPVSENDMNTVLELPGTSQHELYHSNGQEVACSAAGTESLTLGSSKGREDAMDRILGWQLLPQEIRTNGPVTPSQIYGTVHLLRMFVKLPELLKKMHMKDVQLQIIIKFIHHCLQYLVDHQSELFHDSTYIKA
ncbi:male-specific lethal 3 homolog isoform X2 [Physella acuta]|uniref:male-specific lethal 3 homolog isoform X2 n=1 Tax=Physella acuta TaxID=109671 RepID=UPI0027DB0433|nr:male-specific lethal 3 homolog isoform X2 [Physella acuta]